MSIAAKDPARPAGPVWTPAQADAIGTMGGPLLISAAAGSGKTAVLTERAVRLLCDPANPVPADRVLIATFTRAAAAEMRARIGRRLLEEQQKNPSGPARRQRMLLQRAAIGTIDSICLQLLREHFSALDIPPDFRTADNMELFGIRQEALSAALEESYQDPDFRRFADLYGRGRDDAPAEETVSRLHAFLQSLPDPMAALDGFVQEWTSGAPLGDTAWGKELFAEGRRLVEYLRQLSDAALRTCDLRGELEVYRSALESDAEGFEALERVIRGGDWQAACDAVQNFGFKRLGSLKTGDEGARLLGSALQDQRKRYKGIFDKLKEDVFFCTEEEFQKDRDLAAPLAAALAGAVRRFDERFFAAKLEKKLLQFSDIEHLVLRLLRAPDGSRTPLADQVSAGFDIVMVDEYQDTNALQDALYHCLARPDGSNLFFVGDIKQSIYGFRQADPKIFLDKLNRFAPLGAAQGSRQGGEPAAAPAGSPSAAQGGQFPARIDLDTNFRSARGVIDGINFFFERLMSRQLGGVEYGGGQRLVFGTAGAAPGYDGRVEMMLVKGKEGGPGAVARRIRKMMDEGFLVRDKEGTRPARYEDFCILMRSGNSFDLYAAALAAEGIPVYADTAGSLLTEPHIRPLTSLLRVLDNPAQDVYLASVMLSGLFGFTPDDLVRLRAGCRAGSLYGALAACAARVKERQAAADLSGPPAAGAATPPAAGAKADALHPRDAACAAFFGRLAGLRRLARTLPAGQLLERLLAETGYLAAVGVMENGARRREDLLRFVSFAASTAGQGGLPGLVRLLDSAEKNSSGPDDRIAGGARPGCVLITTMHKSKGLEFPVVIVAECTHHFNRKDLDLPLLCHSRLGLGFTLRDPERGGGRWHTAASRAVHAVLSSETLSEEMRVLYVALTRARDCLILSLPLADPDGTVRRLASAGASALASGALTRAQDPGTWLLSAALMHPGQGLAMAAGLAPLPADRLSGAGQLAVSVVQGQPPAPEQPVPAGAPLFTAAPDEALLARLKELFAWQYPRAVLTRVPAKVSVTALVRQKKEEKEELRLSRPAFLAKGGLSGAEKGTLTHAFLQVADLAAAAADPRAEAERQQREGLLDPELAGQLDYDALERFFAGGVFRRLKAAKRVLREYDFITALPAATAASAADKGADFGAAEVLVQGVADLVLVNEDGIEIVDYKTDRGKTADRLLKDYRIQLILYSKAIEKRLALPVKRCTIYSFGLGAEIDVPLGAG